VKDRSTDYFGARATITNAEDLAARSSCVWRLMARRRVTLAGCPDPGQRRTLPLLVLFLKEHSLGALLQQPRHHQYLYYYQSKSDIFGAYPAESGERGRSKTRQASSI